MKHYVVIVVVLFLLAWAHTGLLRAQAAAAESGPELLSVLDIPAEIGGYRQIGEDFDVGEDVRELLQTSLILIRNYESPEGWPVQLTIVYAGTTRRSLHFPEVCLVGQGWEVREQASEMVGFSFRAKRLALTKNNEEQAILYWFKTGDELTGNFYLNSWTWVRNQMAFGTPTSSMIKVSSPIGDRPEEDVVRVLEDFATKLTPIMMSRVK